MDKNNWEENTSVAIYNCIYMLDLGLRKLDVMNQACILKLGWKLFVSASDFWCEVLRKIQLSVYVEMLVLELQTLVCGRKLLFSIMRGSMLDCASLNRIEC
jgi:hypothetical protein